MSGPTFVTRGGPGSVHADLDQIETAAAAMAGLGGAAFTAKMATMSWPAEVGVHRGFSACAARLETTLGELIAGLDRVAAESDGLRLKAHTAIARYETAEKGACGAVQVAESGWGGVGGAMLENAGDGIDARDAEYAIAGVGQQVRVTLTTILLAKLLGPRVAALLGDSGAGGPSGGSARAASGLGRLDARGLAQKQLTKKGAKAGSEELGRAGLLEEQLSYSSVSQELASLLPPEMIAVDGAPVPAPRPPERLDGSVAELLELQRFDDAPQNAIGITHVEAEAGGDVYVVSLPGTQFDGDQDTLWNGRHGLRDAYAGGSEQTRAAVLDAMRAAGVPDGADVVFTGFSQGGMHAVNFTASEEVTGRYGAVSALTVGSPAGGQQAGPDADVLNIVDTADMVTAVDGGPDPTTARRGTVEFSSEPALTEAELEERYGPVESWDARTIDRMYADREKLFAEMVEAHDMDHYRQLARRLDESPEQDRAEVQGLIAATAGVTRGRVASRSYVRLRTAGPVYQSPAQTGSLVPLKNVPPRGGRPR